ncbi:AI-2E family transporter [Actinomadura barringtoniae]|uniref:AI-2E family transporter n=1 Tax=Actinomadura barringtoniae TaxID=1427535 RepID=A0A939P7P4_9ACTN|nr:AI-2E family transporter [Actinomadura barringtoniae]MBO2446687.1 AI-2E family transporter [Actinomadura barringtoniae]
MGRTAEGGGHGGHGGSRGGGGSVWSPGLVLMVGAAAAVLVLAGMKAASSFVAPAFLAMILTIAVSPLRNWLQRIGAPFWVCVAVPLVTVIVVLLALGAALAISAAQLASLLPGYSHQFNELVTDVTQQLARHGIDQDKLQSALSKLDPGQVFSFVQAFFNGLLSASSALILIVLMLVGMCMDAPGLVRQMEKLLPSHPDVVGALRGFARDTCRYLVVSTVFGLIVAVLDVGVLYWFEVPVPLLWGLLAFLTNYIPNVGFVIGLAPPAVLGLLDGGVVRMIWIIAAYCVINFVLQSLIQPKFLGNAVGLSVTLITLSLILWAWVLGPLGAILAVPLSTLVRALLLDADPSKRWLTGVLSSTIDKPETKAPAAETAGGSPTE